MRVRERSLPKWYWCDPGIVRALKGVAAGPPAPEERGPLFEGLVAQLIRAAKDYLGVCHDWFYWASAASNGMEVDFLLERGGEFIAVEAKAGRSFAESWCKGLRALGGLKGSAPAPRGLPRGAVPADRRRHRGGALRPLQRAAPRRRPVAVRGAAA